MSTKAGDSEMVARSEGAEPSQEDVQADGSRADPFAAVDPVPVGDVQAAKAPEVPVSEGDDAARAALEAAAAGSTKSVLALETHILETAGGSGSRSSRRCCS